MKQATALLRHETVAGDFFSWRVGGGFVSASRADWLALGGHDGIREIPLREAPVEPSDNEFAVMMRQDGKW